MTHKAGVQILVVTYWARRDPLVVNYVLPYVERMRKVAPAGSRVHLVTLEPGSATTRHGEGGGFIHHPFAYKAFGLSGFLMLLKVVWRLSRLVRQEQIDVIHAWCMPAGMIGYLLAKLSGKKLILDSYEPHAEAMVENGTWRKGGLAFRILFHFEKRQTRRAWAVVSATEGMRTYALQRYGMVPARFAVKPACVDLERFTLGRGKNAGLLADLGLQDKLVAVYAGKFGGIYLAQEVFDLFRAARDHWGERLHVVLLTSHGQEELGPYITKAGLPPGMFTIQHVQPEEVPDWMGLADWALTPVKPVPTKRYCTPIKDGEYWAMGLPVMITRDISDDSAIIEQEQIGCVIPSLDRAGYTQAVSAMDELLRSQDREGLRTRIRRVAERYRNFSIADAVYRDLYGQGADHT